MRCAVAALRVELAARRRRGARAACESGAPSQRLEPEPGEVIYSTASAPQDGELRAWEVRLLLAEV